MPAAIHQQFEQDGRVVDNKFHADYSLLYLVLFLLGLFYIVIMYILSSSNQDRLAQLNKSKRSWLGSEKSSRNVSHVEDDVVVRDGGFFGSEKHRVD